MRPVAVSAHTKLDDSILRFHFDFHERAREL
jgi:hypothetical protein